jgi:hypothetical protein
MLLRMLEMSLHAPCAPITHVTSDEVLAENITEVMMMFLMPTFLGLIRNHLLLRSLTAVETQQCFVGR